jgi:hypothetical protein
VICGNSVACNLILVLLKKGGLRDPLDAPFGMTAPGVSFGSPNTAAVPPPSKQPGWKKQQRLQQCENRSHSEAKKTKRQGQQPNKGKENQREQRQGPAQREQDAPQNKKQQDFHFLSV